MATASDLACTYAALILHDAGIPITAHKINTLFKAANVEIDSYWAQIFARLLEKCSVEDIVLCLGPGGGGAAAAAALAKPPEAYEKNEEEEESADEGDGIEYYLFDFD